MITRFWLGTRRTGMTREAFSAHWHGVHGPFGLALPGLRAYVQNHLLPGPAALTPPVFDGCSELDFDDVAAMRAAFASPEIAEADRDERAFADPDRFGVVVTRRHVVSGGTEPDTDARLLCFIRAAAGRTRAQLADATRAVAPELAARVEAVRTELLVAIDDAPEPQACDLVLSLWLPTRAALLAAAPVWADAAADALAGVAFGRELALVGPRRLR